VAELEEGKQDMSTEDTTKKITEISFNDKDNVRAVANDIIEAFGLHKAGQLACAILSRSLMNFWVELRECVELADGMEPVAAARTVCDFIHRNCLLAFGADQYRPQRRP
jgi:hypothetical protein